MTQILKLDDALIFVNLFWQSHPEALFSQKQLAPVVQKSEAWFEAFRCKGGGIPYIKIGHHCLYSKKNVLDYLDKHKVITSTAQYEVSDNDLSH